MIRNGDIHTLVGVVSWGIGCARPEYPGIYAKASAVTSWISTVACNEWGSSVNGLCGNNNNTVTAPTPAPTPIVLQGSPKRGTCTALTVEFRTDRFPQDNSIVLKGVGRTFWNHRGLRANITYRWTRCITNRSCTVLTVTDRSKNGLATGAYMKVTYGSTIMYSDNKIGSSLSINFGNRCAIKGITAMIP